MIRIKPYCVIRRMYRPVRVFTLWVFIILSLQIIGCGERYTSQGNELSVKAITYLLNNKICDTVDECNEHLNMYGGHGDRVNFTSRNPTNRKTLAHFIEFIVENGMEITGGVPISIKVYFDDTLSPVTSVLVEKKFISVEVKKWM